MSKEKTKAIKKKASRRQKKDWIAAYIFIAPVTIGLLIFYVWPFIQNFWFSFNDVNKFNMATFCGLENYKKLFEEPDLMLALKNTILYAVITVPIGLFISLLLATLLNSKIKGKGIYRTIYFLPSITMAAAVALVWKLIFNGDYGILNTVLEFFGVEGKRWLTDPSTALFCVMMVGIWSGAGYNMIILLAGMQGVSNSYYEAAEIDGAGPVQKFFKITIPLVSPTIFFVTITGLIGAFQVFDTLYMMIDIDKNPAFNAVKTTNVLFYQNAFTYGYKGYAAAISIFMFVIIMIITAIQLWGQKKWVNYD
ncbi:carbohydrate ABC transporter permease [Sellimonas intestinalis]|uniref:carbohydrate ABC transporter permease n=1 Tax=Sellimonas intestinalis TaxID=1653434 RepID=UPI0015EC7FFF|nr:sugar ABC transporter permease [Sellimonas intestinalis]MBA2215276.1 sugar ABC transporter permease [Sellimonas intestinalis]